MSWSLQKPWAMPKGFFYSLAIILAVARADTPHQLTAAVASHCSRIAVVVVPVGGQGSALPVVPECASAGEECGYLSTGFSGFNKAIEINCVGMAVSASGRSIEMHSDTRNSKPQHGKSKSKEINGWADTKHKGRFTVSHSGSPCTTTIGATIRFSFYGQSRKAEATLVCSLGKPFVGLTDSAIEEIDQVGVMNSIVEIVRHGPHRFTRNNQNKAALLKELVRLGFKGEFLANPRVRTQEEWKIISMCNRSKRKRNPVFGLPGEAGSAKRKEV
jgi:hypothetical protein